MSLNDIGKFSDFIKAIKSIDNASDIKSQAESIMGIINDATNFEDASKILQLSGVSKEVGEAALRNSDFANSFDEIVDAATGLTKGKQALEALSNEGRTAGNVFNGLWTIIQAHPFASIGTAAAAAAFIGYNAWKNYKQGLIESAQESTNAWKASNNTLDGQIAKYKELKAQLDSGILSPAEEYETRKQILDIQTQITEQYGQQVSGIDLVNGSLQTQVGLLQKISSEHAKQMLNENRKEYKDAETEMQKSRSYKISNVTGALGSLNEDRTSTAFAKELRNIINSYEELQLKADDFGMYIEFTGNASQAEEVFHNFMNDVREASKLEGGNFAVPILDSAAEILSKNKEDVLDNYQDTYKTFLQADMISQGTGDGTVADTFYKYAEAVEKYNDALASGDTNAISKIRSDFVSLSSEVDALLSKEGNDQFKVLFDDITEQLNTVSVKAYDFQEALNGKASGKNQFHKISGDIQNASEKLKNLELDAADALNALVTEGRQTGEKELWSLADAWGITAESSKEEMQAFIDILSQAGIVSSEVSDAVEGISQPLESFSSTVKTAISNFEILKAIMSESTSGAGISAENVNAFREIFGDNADKALEKTANGYHINKSALAELQAQMGEMAKTDYFSALSEQYTELRNIEAQIAAAELFERDTSGLEASRNDILDNISSLQELQLQYESATSAYQQWQAAMSGGEDGDMYDSIYGNLEKAGDLYNKGLTGTNAFREFTDLMSNKDLATASNEEIVRAYEEVMPKIQRYFTEGQEGAQNFLEDVANINSEWAHMNEDGSWEINFGEGNDQAIADALEIDVEAVQAILKKLGDYGYEIHLDEPAASLEKLREQAETANETLANMGDNLQLDMGAETFENVENQIALLKEYIEGVQDSDLEPEIKTDKLDAANSILEYLVNRKKELGETENFEITFNIDKNELQSGYDTLNQLKTDLENREGKIGIETVGLQTEINTLMSQIEEMSPELKVTLGIQGMTSDQIQAGLLDGSIEVPVSANTAQANSNIDSVKNNDIKDKNVTVTANTYQASIALSMIRGYLSGITDKSVTVTVNRVANVVEKNIGNSTPTPKKGPAQEQGPSLVTGSWGNPVAGKKLVGELGREIIVNPHTGRWFTVGDHGAEFVEVPKDAIVFNHLQTKNLLKNGYAIGRGQALADGTAYSSGSGTFNIGSRRSKSYSSTAPATSASSSAALSTASTAAAISGAAEDLKDFVEIYLDVASDLTKQQIDAIDRAVGLANKQKESAKAISDVQDEISRNRQAYSQYMQQANSIGLSEAYASQIRSGSLNIESITDETLSKNMKSYEEWYKKAKECQDKITDLQDQERELAAERLEYIEDFYKLVTDVRDALQKANDAKLDFSDAMGYSSVSDAVRKTYQESLKAAEEIYTDLSQQLVDFKNEFNDLVSKGYIKKYSDEWYEGQAKIHEFNEAISDAGVSVIEFEDKIRNVTYTKIQYLIDGFERAMDKLDARIGLMEARDETIPESIYQKQLDANNSRITGNKKMRDAKLSEQALYAVNSERYQKLADEISKLDKETLGLMEDNEKLKDTIFELRFTPLEDGIDKMESLRSELKDFMGLLNKDAYFDREGRITEEGVAALALLGQSMTSAKQEIADYREGLEKLQESFDNGVISETEFHKKSEEYRKGIRDAIDDVQDYSESLTDLYLKQMKQENEHLQEIIDKRKDALKAKEAYYDYDKKLRSQSRDVNMLKAQIAALEGVNNAGAQAELKRLKQELSDAEDNLAETKRGHASDMLEDGYQAMSNELDEILENTEYQIVHSADKQQAAIQNMLQNVVDLYASAYGKINEIIHSTGWAGSSDFHSNQSGLSTQTGAAGQVSGAAQQQAQTSSTGTAQGTVTSPINNNDSFNQKLEQEISRDPNTGSRPVAELKVSRTSVSLEEGKSTSISTSIRPSDAKNKKLAWKSSDTKTATVSNGTIKAVKAGSCQVTVSTTDGSGISQVISVTVSKKSEPVKLPKPPASSGGSSGGDGIPQIGDAVTYVSGRYYYSSDGINPSGNVMLGKTVYIGHINNASWASKPYAIYRDKGLTQGLGWVSLDQLAGYHRGAKRIQRDGPAFFDETAGGKSDPGSEVIITKYGTLKQFDAGDTVFSNDQVKRLYDWSNSSSFLPEYIRPVMQDIRTPSVVPVNTTQNVEFHVDKLLTIEGGTITKDSIEDLEKMLDRKMPAISKSVSNYMYRDARLSGVRKVR